MIKLQILYTYLKFTIANLSKVDIVISLILTVIMCIFPSIWLYTYVTLISMYISMWLVMLYTKGIKLTENIIMYPMLLIIVGFIILSLLVISTTFDYLILLMFGLYTVILIKRIGFIFIMFNYRNIFQSKLLVGLIKKYSRYINLTNIRDKLTRNIEQLLGDLKQLYQPINISIDEFKLKNNKLSVNYCKYVGNMPKSLENGYNVDFNISTEIQNLLNSNNNRHFYIDLYEYTTPDTFVNMRLHEKINYIFATVIYTPHRKIFNPNLVFRFDNKPKLKKSDIQHIYYVTETIETYYNMVRFLINLQK